MSNKVKVILQARTGSSRLYGKVLLPILNEPLIVLCWKRLAKTNLDITAVIPEGFEDDYLFSVLKEHKINVFRGNKFNVLKRFKLFTSNFKNDDIIIRVTADNPLVDGFFLNKILRIYKKSQLNYFSAQDNIDSIPTGIQAEIFRVKHLRETKELNENSREHVTPEIRLKYLSKKFKVNIFNFKKFSRMELTINYLKDFKLLNEIFNSNKNLRYSYLLRILKNFKKKKNKNIKKLKPSKSTLPYSIGLKIKHKNE